MASLRHKELRCFCSRSPLLAIYGTDTFGKLFVHIKVYKQRRVYAEVLVTEGKVKVWCRECTRWNTIVIRKPDVVTLEETTTPEETLTA